MTLISNTFLPEFRHYLENHQGEFGGIGVTVQQLEGRIIVVSVQPGSPADRAGIKIGDEITAVDGINVKGMSIVELSQLLRGAPGSTVAVGYLQEGRPHTAVMIREIIEILTVRGFMKDRVAVIEIIGFTEKTPEEFRRVLKILRLQLPDGLIVDLRGNPGGSLLPRWKLPRNWCRPVRWSGCGNGRAGKRCLFRE